MPVTQQNIPEIITLYAWNGINQLATRGLIDDQESWWLENFFPIAEGHLRTGYGPSAPLYTAPAGTTIVRMFFANITTTNPSAFMFLDNGNVDRVDLTDNSVHPLGNIWTPQAPHYFAAFKLWQPSQFGNQAGQIGGAVIGSPGGLYAVDANDVVTAPGQPAPDWLAGTSAVGENMPQGLPGIYAMEVYKDRLWVAGPTVISFSGPGNGVDFSAVGGGGSFPFMGDQLVKSYTALKASGGFLYAFGDSSAWVISYVTLVGQGTIQAPFSTNLLFSNVDPENGHRFFRPPGDWSIAMATANGAGIFLLAGQSPMTVISAKITSLVASLNMQPFEPTAASADIFGQKWLLFLGTFRDPDKISRPLILAWNGKVWTTASQNLNLTLIGHHRENSTATPYGSDGRSLYQLFAQPDPNLKKRIMTKAYKGTELLALKDWKRVYCELRDYHGGPEGVSITGTWRAGQGGIPGGAQDISFEVPPGQSDTRGHPGSGKGLYSSLDLETFSPDFVVERLFIGYDPTTTFGG